MDAAEVSGLKSGAGAGAGRGIASVNAEGGRCIGAGRSQVWVQGPHPVHDELVQVVVGAFPLSDVAERVVLAVAKAVEAHQEHLGVQSKGT